MDYKAILFIIIFLLAIFWDIMVSEDIDSFSQPTLAIFSLEKREGGHCSFEIKPTEAEFK